MWLGATVTTRRYIVCSLLRLTGFVLFSAIPLAKYL
jgi:hypothetical protein